MDPLWLDESNAGEPTGAQVVIMLLLLVVMSLLIAALSA